MSQTENKRSCLIKVKAAFRNTWFVEEAITQAKAEIAKTG
jgi:hypothetical protein